MGEHQDRDDDDKNKNKNRKKAYEEPANPKLGEFVLMQRM